MNAQDSSLLRALSHWLFEKRARSRCSNVAIHNRQLAACLLLSLGLHPLHAELPLARLFTVFPPGARAGGTVEVSVSGADLDGPVQLLFSNTNLSSVPKPGDANKFLVTLGSNALPGVCEARFVGRFGISNPRAFVMGDLPELAASEGNNALSSALEVPLGTLVNGRAKASAADFFKFSAKKN